MNKRRDVQTKLINPVGKMMKDDSEIGEGQIEKRPSLDWNDLKKEGNQVKRRKMR